MSVSDSQQDFTSWKQKDVHRPVLRIPLTVGTSSSEKAALAHTAASSPASDVSSLPIPSLDGVVPRESQRHPRTSSNSKPTVAAAAAADAMPLQTYGEVRQEASFSGSISGTASEQLLKEKARLLEEEHESLRMSMEEKMKHSTDALSASASLGRVVGEHQQQRQQRLPSAAASSSSPVRSSRHSSMRSTNSPVDRVHDSVRASQDSVRSSRVSDAPKSSASSSPVYLKSTQTTTRGGLRQQLQPPQSRQMLQLQQEEQQSLSSKKEEMQQASPPPKKPAVDAQGADVHAASAPRVTVNIDTHGESSHSLTVEQLRHDVQNCAREIERLVEDQYDLRCSVRDTLLELSRADPSLRTSSMLPSFAPEGQQQQQQPQQSSRQRQPNPQLAAMSLPSNTTTMNSGVEGSRHHSSSGSGGARAVVPQDADAPAASPPQWLQPWLAQLQADQQAQLQQLREEMVVLVCHAVAEERRTSRMAAPLTHPADPAAVEAAPHAVPVVMTNTFSKPAEGRVMKTGADAHTEEPPSSLLWQRYRRLMSPTPPNRSERAHSSSTSNRSPSEPSVLSTRGQDALWSAVLRMQHMMDAQSAQLAQLTEKLSTPPQLLQQLPPPPAAAPSPHPQQPQQHRQKKPREASLVSTVSTDTSYADTSCVSTVTDSTVGADSVHSPAAHRHHSSHRDPHDRHYRHRSSSSRDHHHRNNDQTKRRNSSRHHYHHHGPDTSAGKVEEKRRRDAPPPSTQLDALQDEMSDLRQLLRDTLSRDQQLQQQDQQQQYMSHTYSRNGPPPSCPPHQRGNAADDVDSRASRYAQRSYVAGVGGRAVPVEDTRYARGVVVPPRQPQRVFQTPNRRTGAASSVPFVPSPYASPIHDEWVAADGYSDRVAEEGDEMGEEEREGLFTPPQLPRQRVRTVLKSSLVYPH